jgi:isoleucyl-tRNA synthetase
LRTLTLAHPQAEALAEYQALIADEVNVKQVVLSTDPASMGEQQLKVNPQIGKRIGGKMKDVMNAQRSGDWSALADGRIAIAGIELGPEDFSLRVVTGEGLDSEPFDGGRGIVVLDTRVYDDLEREGWARDFVRLVQQTRKDAGLEVTDRIRLAARVPENVAGAIAEHRDHVCRETLAVELRFDEDVPGGYKADHKLSGATVTIELARA